MRSAFEMVSAHYAASDRRDLDGMLADFADNCQWTEMDGFPCRGTYIGPQAIIANVFAVIAQTFDPYTFNLERLLDAGNEVIGIGHYSGTHKHTGKSFIARAVHIWAVENGKICRFEQFTDTLRVHEAMI